VQQTDIEFAAGERAGVVSGILLAPSDAIALLLFAHGAGAGMRDAFMTDLAGLLAERRIATFRYQFPSMERGSRRPDPEPVRLATVEAAHEQARTLEPALPCFAGGKSMGGRMSSLCAARGGLDGVRGLVFFGFPLHPEGEPGTSRGDHLARVALPMLFLQGTRDRLADLSLLEPLVAGLGARATLCAIADADHSFRVPRRTGRSREDVLRELANQASRWIARALEASR
jgi:hypothetical protein